MNDIHEFHQAHVIRKGVKPLNESQMKPKSRPFGFASRPIRDGKVERTSKSRKFVADRYTLDECKVTYSDAGERKVTPPRRTKTKVVYFQGKAYRVNTNIAG